ncbi:PLP-dependent aminotransferase family protein [Candidatus Methylospira mobilis]|uniref:PLP-dependent aminotransferase family protein n=1 Tax=Candidatus Methylospira mobilis TaxID=1808979 RepID=A0A5Q0BJ80_9GAMM|nr:PLP-dependent aminotransferase family protein [Candidatus Methylospira mobilis]QFY42234.1 PLP-dependent aminotransferase family protein [Candidatus Methylospira mobilis]
MKHLYETVAEDIAARIEQGVYRQGERLPGVRGLSQQLNVSISTALEAYRLLEDQGKIQARTRSGYYVSNIHRPNIIEPAISDPPSTPSRVTGQSLTRQILRAAKEPHLINLGSSVPHPDLLPTHTLQQATAKVARTYGKRCFDAEELLGNQDLRRQIAKRMAALNYSFAADDIVITFGARDAVRLALRTVCQPGDVIAIESPTFYGLLQVIESCGMQALEIPTHPRDGISLDALQLAIDQWPIKACLLVANFNNPLGSCMPDDRKRSLITLLDQHGIPLIEDDVYGDLAFGQLRPSILMSHNKEADALYCSSFAKTLSPGLRVGWLVPGRRHREKVENLKYMQHQAVPTLNQLVVAHVLEQGGYDRYLRQIRQEYARNIARTVQAVSLAFPEGTKVTQPEGGFALWVEMPAGADAMELHRRAGLENIIIAPGPLFSATQKKYGNFIRISCGAPWSDRIERAIKKLGDLTRELMTKTGQG